MVNFAGEVDRGLISRLYSRRIPFTSFIVGGTTAVINVMIPSPAGSLSVPFTISVESDDKIFTGTTGEVVHVKSISEAIAFIVIQIRRLEVRVGKFTL
jgi:uncharacterized membrane protein YjjB (DUF3815 family)